MFEAPCSGSIVIVWRRTVIFKQVQLDRSEFFNAVESTGTSRHIFTGRDCVIQRSQDGFVLLCQVRLERYFQRQLKVVLRRASSGRAHLPKIDIATISDTDLLQTSTGGIYVSNAEYHCDAFYQKFIDCASVDRVQEGFSKVLGTLVQQIFRTETDNLGEQHLLVSLNKPLPANEHQAWNKIMQKAISKIPGRGNPVYVVKRTSAIVWGSEFPNSVLLSA